MRIAPLPHLLPIVLLAPLATAAPAQSWTNYGGTARRDGTSAVVGPHAASLAWSNAADPAIISWHPFAEDGRVFTVREAGFPQAGGAANDAIVAYDVATGGEIWRVTLPFGGDTGAEWIAWVGGVREGQVYASRSSNLQPRPVRALSAATGATLWDSVAQTEAWAHDGIAFAPNGDPIVGDRLRVVRISALDGSTVWEHVRNCSVSGNCGVAVGADAVYIDTVVAGGQALAKLDLASGALLYSGPMMPGTTVQNAPFLAPDGKTVYLSRTQNNPATDYLYAFDDNGTALVQLWSRAVRWTTSHEHGFAADGSPYAFLPGNEFARLDPLTGATTATAGVLAPIGTSNLSPKTAVGGDGTVYVSNGWASSPATDGHLWAFSADLAQLHFELVLDRPNAGGPILAGPGMLVVCDRASVRAYRDTCAGSFVPYGSACPGASGQAPQLAGLGCPVPGSPVELRLSGGTPGAPALLVAGTGQFAITVGSGCEAAIFPVTSWVQPLSLDGAGAGSFGATLPPGLAPGLVTFQGLVVDLAFAPDFFSLSNALAMLVQ